MQNKSSKQVESSEQAQRLRYAVRKDESLSTRRNITLGLSSREKLGRYQALAILKAAVSDRVLRTLFLQQDPDGAFMLLPRGWIEY